MDRVLVLASVASMIDRFNMQNIALLQELGYEVHVACNFLQGSTCSMEAVGQLKIKLESINVKFYQIDFSRSILHIRDNLKAYNQVKKILRDNQYRFIHCHSPIGGVVGRLAARKLRTRVVYTAHGFHFFKGAPLLNWFAYYPMEKLCSRYTDVLITINKEDYTLAQKKMKAKRVEYVPGVGVDVENFANLKIDRRKKRGELGIGPDDIMLLSVGELNRNKNHELVLCAVAALKNPRVHYFIAGIGGLKDYLLDLAKKLQIENKVHLLGYRTDIAALLKATDIFCFPSFREGLSVAVMEAMAAGAPCIVSKIRGNTDLIGERGGYCFSPENEDDLTACLEKLIDNKIKRSDMGDYNKTKISDFKIEIVLKYMKKLYSEI